MARPEESNVSENIKHGTALAIIPKTFDEAQRMSAVYAKSNLLPVDLRGKEPDVFVTIMAGQELGLPPMASLRSIHVVKGKPVLSADAMVAVALRSGQCEYFRRVSADNISATYETKRVGSEPTRATWTIEDAKTAQLLSNDNWKKYPRAMLKARCKAELARDVYPDVLAGVYEEGEAREFEGPQEPSEYIDAEVVERAEPIRGEPIDNSGKVAEVIGKIEATRSEVELQALAPDCNAFAKGTAERATVFAAYKAHREILVQAARDDEPATHNGTEVSA
jgi:hypothetical protein